MARLRVAVKSSDTVALRKILAAHPELLNSPDEKGMTLLHLAAEWQDFSVVAALVDLGAAVKAKDPHGWTPEDIAYFNGEFRMGCYTEVCLNIVDRLSKPPRTSVSD
jgi:ankyrin repeat protein